MNKDTGFYTLDSLNIAVDKLDETLDKMNYLKDEIKHQQINYYDDKKQSLLFDDRMTDLISTFLTNAKKDKNIDASKLKLILNSILANLYEADTENIRFIDEQTIEHLVKATVSNILNETKTHLNEALVNTLIQIRKLAILWFFDSISLTFYNLKTDRSENYKLQENKEVEIKGIKYEIIPLNIKNKKYQLAFSETEYSLTTFDIGIKSQNMIIPILAALFIDKASLKWRLNYSKIIIKAISRLKEQSEHQIKNLKLDYDKVSIEELMEAEKGLSEGFEFLYQILFNYRNQIQTENQSLKKHYLQEYSRGIQSIVGGAISNAVRKVTPLELLDQCDALVTELEITTKSISNLKFDVISSIQDMIKAKKEDNPSMFQKAMKKYKKLVKTF